MPLGCAPGSGDMPLGCGPGSGDMPFVFGPGSGDMPASAGATAQTNIAVPNKRVLYEVMTAERPFRDVR